MGGRRAAVAGGIRRKGFTLAEMSMVLVVAGVVMMIVFPALSYVRVSAQRSLTESNLQSLLRAAAVYVQVNGCLPCPTPAGVSGAGFGRVRGDTGTAACGGCAQAEGIAPFVSLGVPQSTARDGWGRWITMRIDPALAVNFGVAPPTSPCTAADVTAGICAQEKMSQKGLCRQSLSAANRINVQTPGGPVQQAAVIFVSHGANGHGSFVAGAISNGLNGERLPFPGGSLGCASGVAEKCNADGDVNFVNAPHAVGGTNPFDDSLAFMDRNNLVSMLGNGSCHTVW